ncbi:MAG: HepT-like ribonuclease domain-containing protein [Pseudomonadota bacterium]
MPPEIAPRDRALLLDMLLAARDARSFVADLDEAGFVDSRLHQNAVIRALEIIGEAAGKVSPGARDTLVAIPWREVIGMRHRLIHGYADVSLDVVWATVRDELPALVTTLESVIPAADDPELST